MSSSPSSAAATTATATTAPHHHHHSTTASHKHHIYNNGNGNGTTNTTTTSSTLNDSPTKSKLLNLNNNNNNRSLDNEEVVCSKRIRLSNSVENLGLNNIANSSPAETCMEHTDSVNNCFDRFLVLDIDLIFAAKKSRLCGLNV